MIFLHIFSKNTQISITTSDWSIWREVGLLPSWSCCYECLQNLIGYSACRNLYQCIVLPVHAQSFTNSCYYQWLNNLINILVITSVCRNLYKYLLLRVPAETCISTCYYECLQKLVLVITSSCRNLYRHLLLPVPAEYCEAYSLLFQVQRLAQYEQYFQSILRESHHDHADHEDVSRAAAKAKQVGDILNISYLFYTRRIQE